MKRILVALTCTPESKRAVEYVARVAPHLPECEVVLLAVATGVPFGDAVMGDLLGRTPELHGDEDHQQELGQLQAFLARMSDLLLEAGLPGERLETAIRPLQRGVAQDLVTEAEARGAETLVLGRRSRGRLEELFEAGTSAAVLKVPGRRAVWVVE